MDLTTQYDENTLLALVSEGNEAAFTTLFKKYAPLLELNIQKVIPAAVDVSEILQETFIRIWLNREKLNDIQNARGYFSRIAANLCFDHLSRSARLAKLNRQAAPPDTLYHTPETSLSYKETESLVQSAINELPMQRRTIYELSRKEGLNSTQISQKLNLSPDYVRQAIRAARNHIRETLVRAGKVLTAISGIF